MGRRRRSGHFGVLFLTQLWWMNGNFLLKVMLCALLSASLSDSCRKLREEKMSIEGSLQVGGVSSFLCFLSSPFSSSEAFSLSPLSLSLSLSLLPLSPPPPPSLSLSSLSLSPPSLPPLSLLSLSLSLSLPPSLPLPPPLSRSLLSISFCHPSLFFSLLSLIYLWELCFPTWRNFLSRDFFFNSMIFCSHDQRNTKFCSHWKPCRSGSVDDQPYCFDTWELLKFSLTYIA